jgi:hypothetical protein
MLLPREMIRVICLVAYGTWYGTATWPLHSWAVRATHALSPFYAPTKR